MNNTYHVIGTLTYTLDDTDPHGEYGDILPPSDRQINEEIEADWAVTATDSFEVNGWKWRGGEVDAYLITESMRMEAAGQPMLLPLPPADLKMRQLRLI